MSTARTRRGIGLFGAVVLVASGTLLEARALASNAPTSQPVWAKRRLRARRVRRRTNRVVDNESLGTVRRRHRVDGRTLSPSRDREAAGVDERRPPKVLIKLDESGRRYVRFISWIQVWARALELNPGSQVSGQATNWAGDFALRRARLKLLAKPLTRLLAVFQISVNNQSLVSGKPQSPFVQDAYLIIQLWRKLLYLGGGLHYWNGLSRLSSTSTARQLALDAPTLNWPHLGRTDQSARQLGMFLKGQVDRCNYRVSLNRPFVPDETNLDEVGMTDYRDDPHTFSTAGYFEWMFFDLEDNEFDSHAGTYLGKKRVLNLGTGYYWHPASMATREQDGTITQHDAFNFGLDVFADVPVLKNTSAVTAYLVYYNYRMGPNYVRNVGAVNIATEGTTFSGPGNATPVIGTGHHLYGQIGMLLPWRLAWLQIQPYATLQLSFLDGLQGTVAIPEIGVNWLGYGHNLKLTTHYRNHPVFETSAEGKPRVTSRRSSFVLQLQAYF